MKVVFSFCLLLLLAVFVPRAKDLPINQYQVIGSHNSYKQAIDSALLDICNNHGWSIVIS